MGLKTKQVGKYTVSQAGIREAVRNVSLAGELVNYRAELSKDLTAEAAEILDALTIWPLIAGCTWPIISINEWLQIPLEVLNELREAAIELNPAWFAEGQSKKN